MRPAIAQSSSSVPMILTVFTRTNPLVFELRAHQARTAVELSLLVARPDAAATVCKWFKL